jgi:prephenate dehydratase
MRIGFQGEPFSYSDQASQELFPEGDLRGFETFSSAFDAIRQGEVDLLVVPIENSTTGSVLPVLDRLLPGNVHIIAEHLVEVRHCLLVSPGTTIDSIETVHSHPEALAQAESFIARYGWTAMPEHDTAGAVRLVADRANPSEAALGPARAAAPNGLEILVRNVVDREHNTTRFVVVALGESPIADDADKSTVAFTTSHTPGALALALTELGLRGANLTRIESRPSEDDWQYRFFVDLRHEPGAAGLHKVFDPRPSSLGDIRFLGTYKAVR